MMILMMVVMMIFMMVVMRNLMMMVMSPKYPVSNTSTLFNERFSSYSFDFHLRIRGKTVVGTVMAGGMFVKAAPVNFFPIFHPTVKAKHTDLM